MLVIGMLVIGMLVIGMWLGACALMLVGSRRHAFIRGMRDMVVLPDYGLVGVPTR